MGVVEKFNPLEKVVIVRKDLGGIDTDDNRNFKDLLRFNEEYRNLKVVVDGGELTGNIKQKNKSDVFKTIDVHSVINAVGESISSISKWNIVNQFGKHDFSCG